MSVLRPYNRAPRPRQENGKKTAFSICDCVYFRVAPAARATNRLSLVSTVVGMPQTRKRSCALIPPSPHWRTERSAGQRESTTAIARAGRESSLPAPITRVIVANMSSVVSRSRRSHDSASKSGAIQTLEPNRYDGTSKAMAEARNRWSRHEHPGQNGSAIPLILSDRPASQHCRRAGSGRPTHVAAGSLGTAERSMDATPTSRPRDCLRRDRRSHRAAHELMDDGRAYLPD